MTSIEELFKSSNGTKKRKFDIGKDANDFYKSTKLTSDSDVKSNGHASRVEDDGDDDVTAGPELPPEDVEDLPDDEDGRFFGGGVSKNTADVLDYIGDQDEDDTGPEVFDQSWLRKLALNFEKRISKNAELRAKFDGSPDKFMASEADLDTDIKALSILSEHTDLYEEFVKLGCVSSLTSLLSHENTDIAIDTIEIIDELTDDDVDAEPAEWDALVDALLEADVLNLLSENLLRLNEDLESDRAGVYHILGVVENLSSRSAIAEEIGTSTTFLSWLMARIQAAEPKVTQNKGYAAEVLTILLQSSSTNRERVIAQNALDILLQLLSPYRKRDPGGDSEEEGYFENVFDSLTCCVDETEGKAKFIEAEGVELCLLMRKEGKMSKLRALCVLDHALSGPEGRQCCEALVNAAGLKGLFGALMKKPDGKSTEHILGIFASLLRSLPANEGPRIRVLAKFVEKDYQAVGRLVTLHGDYLTKVHVVDEDIKLEKKSKPADEGEDLRNLWFLRRLDAGLFLLQTIATILAWLIAEDEGSEKTVKKLLAEKSQSVAVLRTTLQEQVDEIQATTSDQEKFLKDMLTALIPYLR